MATMKPPVPTAPCPGTGDAAAAALRDLRRDPGPATAAKCAAEFRGPCPMCDEPRHGIDDDTYRAWYAARMGYDAVGDALERALFPHH
jgi:hypothetical protein